MIRAALIVFALTGPASAGAWEEFERRCLVPIENVKAVDLTGLQHRPDVEGIEGGKPPGFEDFSYYSSEHDKYIWLISVQHSYCALLSWKYDAIGEALLAKHWVEEALASERYIDQGKLIAGYSYLESSNWREPRIWLTIQVVDTDQVQFIVEETDLES